VIIVKIIVIILKNTFYIEYCKKTFLNPDFLQLLEQGLTILTLLTVVT